MPLLKEVEEETVVPLMVKQWQKVGAVPVLVEEVMSLR